MYFFSNRVLLCTDLSGTGDDGLLVVWDLQFGQEAQVISVVFNGPVCTAVWASPADHPTTMFAFGCCDGTLFVYHQPMPEVSQPYSVPSHSLKLTLTNSLSTNTPPALMHMKAGSKMLRMTRNKADLQLQEMDVSRCGTLILKVLVLYPLRPLFFH